MKKPVFGFRAWERYECRRKKWYQRQTEAVTAMKKANSRNLNVYKCHYCNGYHIGHISKDYPVGITA